MIKKIKLYGAIIGMGIGEKHLQAIHKYRGNQILIICEKDKKKIILLKKKYPKIQITNNENDIFNNTKINLVSLASYDEDHFKQIVKCIKSKKNIIVEKPMCLTMWQLKRINDLLKKNKKIKIISNLVLRVNSRFLYLKKNIDKNKVFYIEADYDWGRVKILFEWRSKQKNYSITLGAGIHMIDLVMWILNERPISVIGYANKNATLNTCFKKYSFAIYIFKFSKNVFAKVTANAGGTHKHFHHVKVYEKNKTYVNSYKGAYEFSSNGKFKDIRANYPDKKNRKNLIRGFINELNLNKKNKITHQHQFDLMSACLFADKSIKYGKELKIRYLS